MFANNKEEPHGIRTQISTDPQPGCVPRDPADDHQEVTTTMLGANHGQWPE
jgi:hypothetical protein